MKKCTLLFVVVAILFSVSQSIGMGIYAFPVDSLKDQVIDRKIIQYDIILLDIRTSFDVGTGIIASENCRPYHISFDLDDWEGRYHDLPNIPIIIYCNGGFRAQQAAQYLINKGYEKVAVLDGGIQSYKGTLLDSSYFKPWSDLPQPSYQFSSNVIRKKSCSSFFINTVYENTLPFNLIGQCISPCVPTPKATVVVIQRIGDNERKKITGLRLLPINENH